VTADFTSLLRELPSVQQFVRAITEDLAGHRSVVVLLPAIVETDLVWSMLERELWHRNFAVEEVRLDELPKDNPPAPALGDALRVAWPPAARDLAALLSCPDLPEIIVLEGIEALPTTLQDGWLRFIAQWADASQDLPGRESPPPVICAIVRSSHVAAGTVSTNVRLGLHWWWQFPSALEVRLLCRLAGSGRAEGRAEQDWQEHVIPAFAAGDLELVVRLWDARLSTAEQVVCCVRELAGDRGWTAECLQAWGVLEFRNRAGRNGATLNQPPAGLRVLWAQGALQASREYGVELHPSALCVLGQEAELQHRLWRGQAELILPALDAIRLELCRHLTSIYGEGWPLRWERPQHADAEEALQQTSLACGWGYLEHLLRNRVELARERRWLSLVAPAVRARNDIAHHRTIARRVYEQVLDQYVLYGEVTGGGTRPVP
jgi:hypothetical protein